MGDIRELTIENLTEMTELFISVFKEEPWNESWELSVAEERLEIIFTKRYSVSLGYYENGQLIGFVLGNREPFLNSTYFALEEMCVAPKYQGTGVGTTLFSALESKLKGLDVKGINLKTLNDFPAMDFYGKQGFEVSKRVSNLYKAIK